MNKISLLHKIKSFFINRFKRVDKNTSTVLKNTGFAFLVKGLSLCVSLFTTPAFITYFDDNAVLGVWYTMLSVLMWVLNFDLGLGNGIRNRLVKDIAHKDYESAKITISSGMCSCFFIALVLSLLGITFLSSINLTKLYNIDASIISSEVLYISTIMVFMSIIIRFFLTTVSSIFYALQKSSVNNFLHLCVTILQLAFVKLFNFGSASNNLLFLSLAYMILSNLPVAVAGIIIFNTSLKKCKPNIKFIKKERMKSVMNIGVVFFVCQILYMLLINTNEFIITSFCGPQYTTEYYFYFKLVSLISTIITLAITPIWSMVTKVTEEKNFEWLWNLYKKLKHIGLGAVLIQFLFIPIMQIVMDIWLGKNSIQVNYITALYFALFGGAFVYSSILSSIVCGMAKMKLQMIFYGIGIIMKFFIIYILLKAGYGWNIVVLVNAIVLIPYCIAQQIELNRFIKIKMEENKNVIIH
ncbi:MAG: hypothetical protein E7365_00505 [Clostridiales bacterium]|nr:hypothetical protein [Clostridiales bacterium]